MQSQRIKMMNMKKRAEESRKLCKEEMNNKIDVNTPALIDAFSPKAQPFFKVNQIDGMVNVFDLEKKLQMTVKDEQ